MWGWLFDDESTNQKRRRTDETSSDRLLSAVKSNDLELIRDLLVNDANALSVDDIVDGLILNSKNHQSAYIENSLFEFSRSFSGQLAGVIDLEQSDSRLKWLLKLNDHCQNEMSECSDEDRIEIDNENQYEDQDLDGTDNQLNNHADFIMEEAMMTVEHASASSQPDQQHAASGYPNNIQDCISRFGVYGMYYILMLREKAASQLQSGRISHEWDNPLKEEVLNAVLTQFSNHYSAVNQNLLGESDPHKRKFSETDCEQVWQQDPNYKHGAEKRSKIKDEKQGTKRKRDELDDKSSNADFFRLPPGF